MTDLKHVVEIKPACNQTIEGVSWLPDAESVTETRQLMTCYTSEKKVRSVAFASYALLFTT